MCAAGPLGPVNCKALLDSGNNLNVPVAMSKRFHDKLKVGFHTKTNSTIGTANPNARINVIGYSNTVTLTLPDFNDFTFRSQPIVLETLNDDINLGTAFLSNLSQLHDNKAVNLTFQNKRISLMVGSKTVPLIAAMDSVPTLAGQPGPAHCSAAQPPPAPCSPAATDAQPSQDFLEAFGFDPKSQYHRPIMRAKNNLVLPARTVVLFLFIARSRLSPAIAWLRRCSTMLSSWKWDYRSWTDCICIMNTILE